MFPITFRRVGTVEPEVTSHAQARADPDAQTPKPKPTSPPVKANGTLSIWVRIAQNDAEVTVAQGVTVRRG